MREKQSHPRNPGYASIYTMSWNIKKKEGDVDRSAHRSESKIKTYVLMFYQKPVTSNITRDRSFVSLINFKSTFLRAITCCSSVHSRNRCQDGSGSTRVSWERESISGGKGEPSDYNAERRQGRNDFVVGALHCSTVLREILAMLDGKAKIAC